MIILKTLFLFVILSSTVYGQRIRTADGWKKLGGVSVMQDSVLATEVALSFSDITTNNATTSLHGFLRKLDGLTTTFLRGDGTWAAPTASAAWGSITGTLSAQTDLQTALDAKQNALGTSTVKIGSRMRVRAL